jgi:hypothetical protein
MSNERLVSPAVFTKENDQSFLQRGIGQIGGAIVGPFRAGPAFVPTTISNRFEFESIFGAPDGTYYTDYAAKYYLDAGGTATIVRVGNLGGYTQIDPLGIVVSSSYGRQLIGTLHSTHIMGQNNGFTDGDTQLFANPGSADFRISGSVLGDYSASIRPATIFDNKYAADIYNDSNSVLNVFGTSAKGNKPPYMYTYFNGTAIEVAPTDELQSSNNGIPFDADVYVILDSTSMRLNVASEAADATLNWFYQYKKKHPNHTGNIYIFPIDSYDTTESERYLSYPFKFKEKTFQYFTQLGWGDLAILPPNWGDDISGAPGPDYELPTKVLFFCFIDEVNPAYHGSSLNFTGQPTTKYNTDLSNFKDLYNSGYFDYFRAVLYPIHQNTSLTKSAYLQGLAAITGRTLTSSEISASYGDVLGKDIASANPLTINNPYTDGLENYDWVGIFNRSNPSATFASSTFISDLNQSLTDTSQKSQIELVELPNQNFLQDITYASTPWIQSQLISGERYNLFRFHTIGDGSLYNRLYKISIYNVIPSLNPNVSKYGTFSIDIRHYKDSDDSWTIGYSRFTVLETYHNVSLNPASPNYLPKVIGDRNLEIDINGKQTENGDYQNKSKYIRVEISPEASFPETALPFGHNSYYVPVWMNGNEQIIPPVIYRTESIDNTVGNRKKYSGIELDDRNIRQHNENYLKPIPNEILVGDIYGSNSGFYFDEPINIYSRGNVGTYNFGFELTGSNMSDVAKRQFTVVFQGGFDGLNPNIHKLKAGDTVVVDNTILAEWGEGNSQGFDMSTSTSSGTTAYLKAIGAVSNPDDYDINLIITPGIVRRYHPYIFDKVVEMVENRGDAFYIGDLTAFSSDYSTGKSQMDSIDLTIEQAVQLDSSYVASYYPWISIEDFNINQSARWITVPPSILMMELYERSDRRANTWNPPAGLTRGTLTRARNLLNKLTQNERDILYSGKVNPITSFSDTGITVFGQKTLQERESALDRINVRRMLIQIKKFFASTSRYLVFEQNTEETRNSFLEIARPYLDSIVVGGGLTDYNIVMDTRNNTADVIDRNILAGKVELKPTRSIEFITLEFNITPTGASFG